MEDKRAWFARQQDTLEDAFSKAFNTAYLEQAADPIARVGELLLQSRGVKPTSQTNNSDMWTTKGFAASLGVAAGGCLSTMRSSIVGAARPAGSTLIRLAASPGAAAGASAGRFFSALAAPDWPRARMQLFGPTRWSTTG